MTTANIITIIRIILVPFFLVILLTEMQNKEFIAFAIFVIAAVTDALDGYFARKYNEVSDLGKFLDPLADKLLVSAALIALVYLQEVETWVAAIIILRELFISVLPFLLFAQQCLVFGFHSGQGEDHVPDRGHVHLDHVPQAAFCRAVAYARHRRAVRRGISDHLQRRRVCHPRQPLRQRIAMPYPKYRPLNRKNLKTISIKERKSLVHLEDFPKPYLPGADFRSFIDSLPPYLAAKDLREFVDLLGEARKKNKPIIWGMGAHVVKLGLSPLIIDLMQRGWISAIATNGAMMIHDFEIALAGKTSEDVGDNLLRGNYGNTEETGLFLNLALKEGLIKNMGAGEAVGYYLIQAKLPHLEQSILFNAYKLNIPVTIHPAIGTDFIHYHPMFAGEITGALAERDFQLLASIVSEIERRAGYS